MMELQYPVDCDAHDISDVPMSRTHQYRKVMKPLLERKRRARINKCLDELKDLMVYALQSEGESITKLEKADVLELTVRHLQKLKRQQMLQANPALDIDRYHAGFASCANEVSRCLATVPGVDVTLGTNLMTHLGLKLKTIEGQQQQQSSRLSSPLTVAVPTVQRPVAITATAAAPAPAAEPLVQTVRDLKLLPLTPTSHHSDGGYSSGRESISPRSEASSPINFVKREMMVEERRRSSLPASSADVVWRPF